MDMEISYINPIERLTPRTADQKRLRSYFDDPRIYYGFNRITKKDEVWYRPANSRPYKICEPDNVCHAIRKLESRSRADKIRAKDLIRQIDEHNEKVADQERIEAMHEIRHDLRRIASGRQHFMMR